MGWAVLGLLSEGEGPRGGQDKSRTGVLTMAAACRLEPVQGLSLAKEITSVSSWEGFLDLLEDSAGGWSADLERASARLTRSLTTFMALARLELISDSHARKQELCIHVVGANREVRTHAPP